MRCKGKEQSLTRLVLHLTYYLCTRGKSTRNVVITIPHYSFLINIKVMAVKVYLSQNNNSYSSVYGRFFAFADNETPIDLVGLAKHMSEHNTPFSEGTIVGILRDMVKCIRELNLNGQPVKIDGLAIFSTHIENRSGWQKLEDVNLTIGATDEQGKPAGIQALRLCAQATGEFTKAELTKYGTVLLNREWRKKVQEAKKAAGQDTDPEGGDNPQP